MNDMEIDSYCLNICPFLPHLVLVVTHVLVCKAFIFHFMIQGTLGFNSESVQNRKQQA